jgi:sugar phosphate isomerase/epimerase
MKIGLQTFTIRKLIQDEEHIDQTFKIIHEMGIKYLELSYIKFDKQNIDLIEMYMHKYHLKAISSQIPFKDIVKRSMELIRIHKQLDMKYIAVSVIPFRYLCFGPLGMKRLAYQLNKLGQLYKKHGIRLLFHHHNYEFFKYKKKMALDYLVENLDKNNCGLLTDTYWMRVGGFEIISFLEKYADYIDAVHLRGYIDQKNTNLLESDRDFKDVLAYMKTHDIAYGVIEQDTQNEIEEIKKSIKMINASTYKKYLNAKDN